MRLAVLSRGTGWHVQDLLRAAAAAGHAAEPLDFRELSAAVPGSPFGDYDAVLVRTMPAGSLEQIVFRMDLLHAAAAAGVRVVNPPRAVELCVDKFLTTARLHAAGLPVPVTIACQSADEAMIAFEKLGGDAVVKPLFGAEGRGIVRVTDADLAWRTFHAIEQTRGVLYLQEYVRHPGWDVRVFVLNGFVLAAMKRENPGDWRTNVARGGSATRYELPAAAAALALAAARACGTVVAGVDLMLNDVGEWLVIEVNAVPGWRALAEVSGTDVAARVLEAVTMP